MTNNNQYDPYDDAMTDPPAFFAGKCSVNAFQCVLVSGQGKVPYDEHIHGKDAKVSTAIEFIIEPLDQTKKLITSSVLNWTPEFRQVIRPSIEKISDKLSGLKNIQPGNFNPLKEMNGLWVIGEWVEKPNNKPGETYKTISFLDIFSDETSCTMAFQAYLNQPEKIETVSPSQQAIAQDPQRATAAMFLPALWAQSGQIPAIFMQLIKSNPVVSSHFDEKSPEVITITGGIPF